ncbi:MAG: PAS domain S-box protein [Deltaproteobacteria bacterium]|nr:MAG: PAS domain S-box protein [Deltaproteobacteria bacterium]
MRLRTILLVLALLAFLFASIGGYLYYSALKESAFKEADRQTASHAKRLRSHVVSTLSENQKAVKALAGLRELERALVSPSEINLRKTNFILDHFHDALEVSVCYLMDRDGNTIASSNRNDSASFVGKNYGFRPYFRQAMQGSPAVYMALGVTSKKRGVYYSHPVYGLNEDAPIGIVVIKASVESMEQGFSQNHEGIGLVTDPHGVIFASNRRDWLYHVLWEVSPEETSEIVETRQFGKGPWKWTGLSMKSQNHAVDVSGNRYLIYQMKIGNYPGWNVTYLVSLSAIHKSVFDPLIGTSGFVIVSLCVLIGLSVFFLYKIASHDIVQRKRAEDALRESEKKFRAITGTAVDAIILMDSKGKISYWNPAAERMFGHSTTEAIGQELHLFLAPQQYHELSKKGFNTFQTTGKGPIVGKTAEFLAIRKDGTQFPIEVSTSALEVKGEWHAAGILRDISERKSAEKELNLQKTYFQHLFENSPEASAILDNEDRIVDANKEFEQLFQYSIGEIKGEFINDLIISDDLLHEAKSLTRQVLNCQVIKKETTRKRKDNTIVDVSVLGYPITFNDEQVGTYAIYQDISERKQGEKALRASEKQYRNLVDNALVGIYKTDLDGNILYANDALIKMLGFESIEEMTSIGVINRYRNIKDRMVLVENLKKAGKVNNFEVELLTNTGDVKNVILTALLEENVISGMIMDITDRRRAEEERIRLATAVEQAAESVIISDRRGTIRYVNPAFERLSGFRREDILGQNFRILKSDRHDESYYQRMWDTISCGRVWSGRINNRMKDGTVCEFETTISPLRDSSGAIVNFVSVNRDVTQEVALEAQLLQAQKMEAVGTLAGGIAHDFNNLLQVVQGYADVLLLSMDLGDSQRLALQKIHRSARRGAELTQQLLTFSRKVESKRRILDLNREVEQVRKLLERTIPKMIEIELCLASDLMRVKADPAQMEQAIMNLAVNAKDAMPDGGKISIETANVTLDGTHCETHLGTGPGKYVKVSISDTGHGMDREIVEHVFEPFYTTKEVGKGTGLGLAMVYGIVKSHDGHILCHSSPEMGTTFKIYLPAIEQESEKGETEDTKTPVNGGTETILLVDDEELIRELGVELFGDAGYRVLTAADGPSALQLYRQEKDKIDLIILDLIIPGIGGGKCLEEILRINPRARVLVASGYSADDPLREAVTSGARAHISKPYNVGQMLALVREVLDQDREP